MLLLVAGGSTQTTSGSDSGRSFWWICFGRSPGCSCCKRMVLHLRGFLHEFLGLLGLWIWVCWPLGCKPNGFRALEHVHGQGVEFASTFLLGVSSHAVSAIVVHAIIRLATAAHSCSSCARGPPLSKPPACLPAPRCHCFRPSRLEAQGAAADNRRSRRRGRGASLLRLGIQIETPWPAMLHASLACVEGASCRCMAPKPMLPLLC